MLFVKYFFIILFVIIVCVSLFHLLMFGIEKSEVVHCLKLKEQSEVYSERFFISEIWDNVCREYGIKINAPVLYDKNY